MADNVITTCPILNDVPAEWKNEGRNTCLQNIVWPEGRNFSGHKARCLRKFDLNNLIFKLNGSLYGCWFFSIEYIRSESEICELLKRRNSSMGFLFYLHFHKLCLVIRLRLSLHNLQMNVRSKSNKSTYSRIHNYLINLTGQRIAFHQMDQDYL